MHIQIEGLDYDARLAAYRKLDPTTWEAIALKGGAAIILQRCFLDLRNADDLALRHAAAQALDRFIQAASSKPAGGGVSTKGGEDLVIKVVFPAAKKAVNASNLAVRQVQFSHQDSLQALQDPPSTSIMPSF